MAAMIVGLILVRGSVVGVGDVVGAGGVAVGNAIAGLEQDTNTIAVSITMAVLMEASFLKAHLVPVHHETVRY
jgi:hypothetical protein